MPSCLVVEQNFPNTNIIVYYHILIFCNLSGYGYCLLKGRHSEAAHEIQGCSSQECSRGGVGHVGVEWGGVGWGGVGHVEVGWDGVGGVGHVGVQWGGSCKGVVGWSVYAKKNATTK